MTKGISRRNFKELKQLLVKNHDQFNFKTTYDDIEKYLFDVLASQDAFCSESLEDWDEIKETGHIRFFHKITIDAEESKTNQKLTFCLVEISRVNERNEVLIKKITFDKHYND